MIIKYIRRAELSLFDKVVIITFAVLIILGLVYPLCAAYASKCDAINYCSEVSEMYNESNVNKLAEDKGMVVIVEEDTDSIQVSAISKSWSVNWICTIVYVKGTRKSKDVTSFNRPFIDRFL